MAKITFKGNEVNTNGSLPAVGAEAPDFKGVKSDLSELHLKDLKGKKVVINVFPSLDTAVCAASVRRFNKEAASLPNTVVLAVSKDLPFAQGTKRWFRYRSRHPELSLFPSGLPVGSLSCITVLSAPD